MLHINVKLIIFSYLHRVIYDDYIYNIYISVRTCYRSTLFVFISVERCMSKNTPIYNLFLLPSKNIFFIRSGYKFRLQFCGWNSN